VKISSRIFKDLTTLIVFISLVAVTIFVPVVHSQEVDSVAQDGGVGALVGVGSIVAPGGIPVQDRQQTIYQKISAIFQRNGSGVGTFDHLIAVIHSPQAAVGGQDRHVVIWNTGQIYACNPESANPTCPYVTNP
jgi:hypothetical protein